MMRQQPTVRTSVLDELGDIYAEKGSRPWAIAVRERTRSLIGDSQANSMHIESMRDLITDTEAYRILEDRQGNPFTSYEVFCVTPAPWGLGYSPGVIDHIIAERKQREVEDRAAEAKPLGRRGRPASDDKTLSHNVLSQGTDADYLTARIARDRPDILERMKAGEYPSVRRAAMDAGIVKPTVTHRATPEAFAHAAYNRLSYAEVEQLVKTLSAMLAADE